MVDCDLPLTGRGVVHRVFTDLAVFDIDKSRGLTLRELAPDVSISDVRRATEAEFEIGPGSTGTGIPAGAEGPDRAVGRPHPRRHATSREVTEP